MIKIKFTEADKQALNYQRYHHHHPRVKVKMEALWLKSQGLSHKEIIRLTGISPNTLRSYFRDYLEGGIEKLKEINFYRPKSDLIKHKGKIEDYFHKFPPSSTNEAIVKIEQITGIKRSATQVRVFLKSLGIHCCHHRNFYWENGFRGSKQLILKKKTYIKVRKSQKA